MNVKKQAIIMASGHMLCEGLPENFEELTSEDIDKYILENAWEPFEHWQADDIWFEIESIAGTMVSFLRMCS